MGATHSGQGTLRPPTHDRRTASERAEGRTRKQSRIGRSLSTAGRWLTQRRRAEELDKRPSNNDSTRLKIPPDPDPSLLAAGVALDWKYGTGNKNCNVLLEKSNSKHQNNVIPEDFSHEFLQQIIRCFPFPSSPVVSPCLHRKTIQETPGGKHTRHDHNTQRRRDKSPKKNNEDKEDGKVMDTLRMMVVNSVDTMAITALPLDCWLRERLKHWCQLSGHEGTIVPASDNTLWKKRSGTDCNEATAYKKLMNDVISPFVPFFRKEVEYKGEAFIEIEDLTSRFICPAIMDIKIGTRTFLESEVKNPVKRKDLYAKMVKIDRTEPTEEEHLDETVTKLRYMQFRERESSTAALGFRIEAMRVPEQGLVKCFQKVRTREEVMGVLCQFMGGKASVLREPFLQRLKEIRSTIERSDFFKTHEVIGSSLLFMYDGEKSGIWMIDFAKALPIHDCSQLDHRSRWELGNHEDGYLTGMDNLIQILEDSRHKELATH